MDTAPRDDRPRTKPGDPNHVPVRRAFDRPSGTQTRLFKKAGPVVTICVHSRLGFHIGNIMQRTLWSHDPASVSALRSAHPDNLRLASSWPNEATARAELTLTLTLADWLCIAFADLQSDVAQGPPAEIENADPTPLWSCSLAQAHATTGLYPLLPEHRLQDETWSR